LEEVAAAQNGKRMTEKISAQRNEPMKTG